MKISKYIWIAVLVVGACAVAVFSQEEGGPPPGDSPRPHHRPPPLPLVGTLDANHDRVIDSNEIANAPTALLTLAKHQDGNLTPDESLPPRPVGTSGGQAQDRRPPPLPIMEALDANHDGVIDATEIANAPAALKALDKNGDGKLTRDEFAPPPPNGPPGNQAEGDFPPPPPDDN